jgi:hypothetical protein
MKIFDWCCGKSKKQAKELEVNGPEHCDIPSGIIKEESGCSCYYCKKYFPKHIDCINHVLAGCDHSMSNEEVELKQKGE